MSLTIYNSITRNKELFEPISPPFVGMYVCGPTVYGDSHLGHARSYLTFDTVYRYLKYLGYKVRYVQNITDVGHLTGDNDDGTDKIGKQADLEKKEPVEIAYKYEVSYFEDMKKLNILNPDISCRATGHIIEIIEHISTLIEKGFAYVTNEHNVYFDVRSFKGYGKLSGRKLEETKSGERISIASDKKNNEDFALWKSADKTHLMKWQSPWGVGYPGWHIECSVMSKKYIGETLDIHGGGIDNVFPHHECEIAQSEALTEKPFTKFFMHNNMLTVNGTKMGKSLNNFIILKELFKETDPMVLRFYVLQSHYRSVLDFTSESLNAAKTGFDRMRNSIFTLKNIAKNHKASGNYPDIEKLKQEFLDAMNDDFNTAKAISVLYDILKISNLLINAATIDNDKIASVYELVKIFTEDILGLLFTQEETDNSHTDELINYLIDLRLQYRNEKNFAMSDQIRDNLKLMGITLKDGPQGTSYTFD